PEEKNEDDEDIIESAEYSSKSDLSKAEKVAKQIEKCNDNRSKEMKEGYNNYDKLGMENKKKSMVKLFWVGDYFQQ
ncbi:unnamed protein product, partial [marine sediment metagenome]